MKKEKKASVSVKERISRQFGSIQFRNGSYSLVTIAVVLVIVILINMIVGQLPKSITGIDISDSLIYETGEVTEGVLDGLEHEVDVLVIAENGSLDSRIEAFLERYAEQSSKISLTYRDPVLHPDVLTEYGVSYDTIVISCEATGKTETISIDDMIQYDDYYLYYQGAYVETAFDGEGLMTSAISYVAADDSKMIYVLNGHQESALSSSVTEMIGKSNMETSDLNLLETASVPDDCELLVINSPQTDLADDELKAIRSYLIGGNVMLLRGITQKELTNFDELMAEYGLTMHNEYVADYERYYQGARSYYNFFPVITSSTTNIDSDGLILVSGAAAMSVAEDKDDTVAHEKLLTTSSNAALQSDSENMAQYLLAVKSVKTYEAGATAEGGTDESVLIQGDETMADEDGEEAAAESEAESVTGEEDETAAETDETEAAEETEGTMLILTVPSMIDSGITDSFQNLENLNEFMNMVTSFFDDVENISIEAKSLEVPYNTVTNPGIWNSLFLFIIPAFCIITGLYVWIKRRKA